MTLTLTVTQGRMARARSLLQAICSGDDRRAKEIILNGSYGCVDSQTSRRDGTALFFCCSQGHLELAQLLVKEAGASVEARTKCLATPLHAAADNGHVEVVRYLLNLGADVNVRTHVGDSPLHMAAFRGYSDIVHLLVQFGADVTAVNANNLTPRSEAVRHGHCAIEHFLRAAQDMHYDRAQNTSPHHYDHMVVLPAPNKDLPSLLPPHSNPHPNANKPTSHTNNDIDHNVDTDIYELPGSKPSFTQIMPSVDQSSCESKSSPTPFQNDNSTPSNLANATSQTSFPSRDFHVRESSSPIARLTNASPQTSFIARDIFVQENTSRFTEPKPRVPEESSDSSDVLSMAVSKLCVPPMNMKPPHRRTSSVSSVSMTSDCSNSGLRSDGSSSASVMSSASDVTSFSGDASSSCGGDSRRDDFEISEMDAQLYKSNSCGLVDGRRKSHPAHLLYPWDNAPSSSSTSSSSSSSSLLNRAHSNPASSAVSEFSDMFNSSLFSFGSLNSQPLSNIEFSQEHPVNNNSSLNLNILPNGANNQLSSNAQGYHGEQINSHADMLAVSRPPTGARGDNYVGNLNRNSYFTDKRYALPMNLADQKSPTSLEGFGDFPNQFSYDRQPSNDLSSIKSSSLSSPTPSMTFLNIPLHE